MATYNNIKKIKIGNNIFNFYSDYLPLTGGQVTGPVTFGDAITIDEATIGDLVVNGSASFTNNISANTINGVEVGSSPKFTDTTYSSLSAASGGTALSLVTTGEKYTWNSKTSNTGTVTKVTAGTGLSIGTTAGGNFTTSGTINHTNSVTAATAGTSSATSGSTLAVPYVTYDAQGHITASGTHTHTISGFLTSSSTLDATKLSGTIPSSCYTNTDTKVNVTLGTTTKAYLLGTSTTPISTATGVTAISDTGVYLDTTAGMLHATTFNGLTLTAASTGFKIAGGTTSKTLTVSGTYTLGAACAKAVTDSSSASAISTGTSLTTERDVYYGLPKINGVHTYTSNTDIYAPTSAGTSGYTLQSNGSGAPSWVLYRSYVQAKGSNNTLTTTTEGVVTQITLSTLDTYSGSFTSSNSISSGGVLIPTDGWYRISASVYISAPTVATNRGIYIKLSQESGFDTSFANATEVMATLLTEPTTKESASAISLASKLVYCCEGQIVYLAMRYNGGSGGGYYGGNTATYLLVEYVDSDNG